MMNEKMIKALFSALDEQLKSILVGGKIATPEQFLEKLETKMIAPVVDQLMTWFIAKLIQSSNVNDLTKVIDEQTKDLLNDLKRKNSDDKAIRVANRALTEFRNRVFKIYYELGK